MAKRKWTLFKSRVEKFIDRVQRTNAKKNVWINVVRTDRFFEFIDFIVGAPQLTDDYKLMITLQLTTGCRISELLNLTKQDFKFRGDQAIAEIDVLKKRGRSIIRYGLVSKTIIPLLQDKLDSLSSNENLFKISRTAVWMQYNIMMGINPHGFRHSLINYLFEQRRKTTEEVVNLMAFSTWEVANKYHNTNPERSAWKLAEGWED